MVVSSDHALLGTSVGQRPARGVCDTLSFSQAPGFSRSYCFQPVHHLCPSTNSVLVTLGKAGLALCACVCFRHVQLPATPWTVALQAPLSIGFSRQEYWSGLPVPSPEDLPDSGIESGSRALHVDSLASEPLGKTISFTGRLICNEDLCLPNQLYAHG